MSFVYLFGRPRSFPLSFALFFCAIAGSLCSIGGAYLARMGMAIRHFVQGDDDSLGAYDLLTSSSDIGRTR